MSKKKANVTGLNGSGKKLEKAMNTLANASASGPLDATVAEKETVEEPTVNINGVPVITVANLHLLINSLIAKVVQL